MWILLNCFHRIYACRKNFVLIYDIEYKKNVQIIYKGSTITGFVSIFALVLFFAVGIKLCAITSRIKMYESIKIKKKEKRHDKIGFLGKDKLNTIEVLISKALIDLCISHNDIVSVVRKILQTKIQLSKKLPK